MVLTLTAGNIHGIGHSADRVYLEDLGALARAMGSREGDPNWNPLADLDNDGEITGDDLSLLASNYGKVRPIIELDLPN